MKTTHFLLLVTALSPVAFLTPSCAKSDSGQPVAPGATAAARDAAADAKTAATPADSWDSIKDYAYEKREAFAAALERMAGKLDGEVRELAAKVAGQTETESTKARNVAVKEFNDAVIYLKSQLADLRTGTADTWDSAKGKVVQAWEKVQATYDQVKASPTS